MSYCLNQIQGFFSLFDKYLKSNDQTHFEAYLKYLEASSSTPEVVFSASKASIEEQQQPFEEEFDENNFKETFSPSSSLYYKFLNESKTELLIAQKAYKFLIVIDYSESSNLQLIEIALKSTIEKISNEYNRFESACKFEPTIYLSVISWHPKYFKYVFNQPFSIIIHSKYLFKNSFKDLASKIFKIFKKIIENLRINRCGEKDHRWDALRNKLATFNQTDYLNRNFLERDNGFENLLKSYRHTSQQQPPQQQYNDFDKLLFYALKILTYFPVDTNNSQHRFISNIILLSDSILQTIEISKQIEMICSTGVKLSFVFIGNQANYSCGFGLKANYSYMKYLSRMTHGFYASLNEHNEYEVTEDNQSIEWYKQVNNVDLVDKIIVSSKSDINSSSSGSNGVGGGGTSNDDVELFEFDSFENNHGLQPSQQPPSIPTATTTTNKNSSTSNHHSSLFHIDLKYLAVAIDDNYNEYYYHKKSHLNSSSRESDCIVVDYIDDDIESFNKKYRNLKNQNIGTKFLCKYEIQRDLFELLRIRLRDGFILLNVCNRNITSTSGSSRGGGSRRSVGSGGGGSGGSSSNNLRSISIYLVRYFTQTCAFLYKITYNVMKMKFLFIELWLLSSYVNVKTCSLYASLSQQIQCFVSNLQMIDIDYRLDMTVQMLTIPENMLQRKEPLFKRMTHKQYSYFYKINKDLRRSDQQSSQIEQQLVDVNESGLTPFALQWNKLAFYELYYDEIDRYYTNYQVDFYFDLQLKSVETVQSQMTEIFKEWSNVVLVDNGVYLKYLRSSNKYKTTSLVKLESAREREDTYYSNYFDSFLIFNLNLKNLPYCSIKYTFHMNISNTDCELIIEKHKKLINDSFSDADCIYYPSKPEICSQFEKIMFPDDYNYFKNLKLYDTSVDILNYMHQQKYYWSVSVENAESRVLRYVKQTIVDICLNTRLNEGFKFLFKTNEFIVMQLELDMCDNGVCEECVLNANEKTNKTHLQNFLMASTTTIRQSIAEPLTTSSPIKTKEKEKHIQKVSLIYVLKYVNENDQKSGLEEFDFNIIFPANQPLKEDLFITEIYIETINGVCDFSQNNNNLKYFNGLDYNQIVNLIYLNDLKVFLTIQSVYSLIFLEKNNFCKLLSKHEISKSNQSLLENRTYKIEIPSNETLKESSNFFYYNSDDYEYAAKDYVVENHNEIYDSLSQLAVDRHLPVAFEFTFGEILRESAIVCCVYDDIPIDLLHADRDYLNQINNIFSSTLLSYIGTESFEFLTSLGSQQAENQDYENHESTLFQQTTLPGERMKMRKKLTDISYSLADLNTYLSENIKKMLILRLNELFLDSKRDKSLINDLIRTLSNQNEMNLSQSSKTSSDSVSSSTPNERIKNFNYFLKLCDKDSKTFNSITKVELMDAQKDQLFVFAYCFLDSDTGPNQLVTFVIDLDLDTIKTSLNTFKKDIYIIRKNLFEPVQSLASDNDSSLEENNIKKGLLDALKRISEQDEVIHSDHHQELPQFSNLSMIMTSSTHLKINCNLVKFSSYIEHTCSLSYLSSIMTYLGAYTINNKVNEAASSVIATPKSSPMTSPLRTSELILKQQNVTLTEELNNKPSLNKEGVSKLLKIATRSKIVDVDLTDYLYSICDEFKALNFSRNNFGNDICKRISLISENENVNLKKGEAKDENEERDEESEQKEISRVDDHHDESRNEEADDEVFQNEAKLKQNAENKSCSLNFNSKKLKYFEKKFKNTFLDEFNILPGFNDLFLITSPSSKELRSNSNQFELENPNDEPTANLRSSSPNSNNQASSSDSHRQKYRSQSQLQKMLKDQQNNLDFYRNRIVGLKFVFEMNEVDQATDGGQSNHRKLLMSIERKFSKFNLTCICDLISEDDNKSIKSFLMEYNTHQQQQRKKPTTIEFKVYLRFNSYSFADQIKKSQSPLSLLMPTLHRLPSYTPTIFPSHNTGGQLSNNNEQSPSSNYNALFSLIEQFKWYLNDEIFQKRDILTNLSDFNQFVQHVSEGIKRKCFHCEFRLKDIAFSNLTNNYANQFQNDEHIKFKSEFLELIDKLDGQFHNCKLQKVDEHNYFLNCSVKDDESQNTRHKSLNKTVTEEKDDESDGRALNTFKILIHINDSNTKQQQQHNNLLNSSTLSPSRTPSPIISPGSNINSANTTPIKQTQSLYDIQINNTNNMTSVSNKTSSSPRGAAFSMDNYKRQRFPRQQSQQQKSQLQQQQQQQQIALNNMKIEIYFIFNHFTFSDESIKTISNAFFDKLEYLINSVYLKLILKNIDDTKKWNNYLQLTNDYLISNFHFQKPVQTPCVWSYMFKLHRLQQLPHCNISNSATSFGLQKLKEYLQNFKIDDTSHGDTYVYELQKDMYLLTLHEIENPTPQTPTTAVTQSVANVDDNLVDNDEINALYVTHSVDDIHLTTGAFGISRRQSYANPDEPKLNLNNVNIINNYNSASNNSNISGSITNISAISSKPDFIKLSLFGLTEPSNEFKDSLCKTLQTELDCCLIEKFWASIDKNNFKTTSAQHPDKILEDDITFIKNISDNYFDEEISIPTIFNLNKQLRDQFFYYIRFILNTNFKAMDVNCNNNNAQKINRIQINTNLLNGKLNNNSTSTNMTSPISTINSLQSNIIFQPTLSHSCPVSTVLSQKLSFSFVAFQPPLGPNLIDPSTLDNGEILLSRIFPHNSKCRIGKHTLLPLSLIECVYAPKGLDKIIKSRIVKSQSPPQQHAIESIISKCSRGGPTIGFKYYSRGEHEHETIQVSLKQAINQALLIFFCDYLTKIDSEFYTKCIILNENPTRIRQNDFSGTILQQQAQQIDLKSYQEVIEYLRELIPTEKQFDYNKIFNDLLKSKLNNENEIYKKTYLKLIYDWFHTLYHSYRFSQISPPPQNIQQNPLFSRSNSMPVHQSLSIQSNSSPTSSLNTINLIYRKEFAYRTRSNLINLVQDFISSLKEICKLDVNMNYYSFINSSPAQQETSMHDVESFLINEEKTNCEFNDIDDFENLKQTSFKNFENDLIRNKNLIIIFNVDYILQQQQQQATSNIKSSNLLHHVTSASSLPNFNRQNPINIMNSQTINDSIQMQQRIFCYALVDSKKKCLYFYAFTNENSIYNSIKQTFEQLCDIINYRTNLVNNIILFKFGGLIGDQMMVDIKNLKISQLQASQQQQQQQQSVVEASIPQMHPLLTKTQSELPQRSTNWSFSKASKSPTTTTRQFVFPLQQPQKQDQQQQQQQLTPQSVTNLSNFNIKQFYMNIKENRSCEPISNLINQQLFFYAQSFHTPPNISSATVQQLSFQAPPPPPTSYSNDFHYTTSQYGLSTSLKIPQNSNRTSPSTNPNLIYGVGFNYHIQEANQIFRHPRKIYDVITSTFGDQNINDPNSCSSTPTPHKTQSQHGLNEFYKNTVVPVLHPYQHCCTPVLFFPDWADKIVNESSLKTSMTNSIGSISSQTDVSTLGTNSSQESKITPGSVPDAWYRKMRQIYLSEFSKHFVSFGFMRLKDERKYSGSNDQEASLTHFIKWIHQDGFVYLTLNFDDIFLHIRFGFCPRYRSSTSLFFNEINYLVGTEFHFHSASYDYHLTTINRNFQSTSIIQTTASSSSATKQQQSTTLQSASSLQTLLKFLEEFYEYFTTRFENNIKVTKKPYFALNKIYKDSFERPECSLIPKKIGIIFDYILNRKDDATSFLPIHTNLESNIAIYSATNPHASQASSASVSQFTPTNELLANNQRQQEVEYIKYLVVKIENLNSKPQQSHVVSTLTSSSSSTSLHGLYAANSTKQKPLASLETSLVRVVWFYLCVNKQFQQQQHLTLEQIQLMSKCIDAQLTPKSEDDDDDEKISNDLHLIKKIIDDSINTYKREIFWDNLMVLIQQTLQSSTAVQSQDLEYILKNSYQIYAHDIKSAYDQSLKQFYKHSYLLKDKIMLYFEQNFGKNFIEVPSTSFRLLIVNNFVISKMKNDSEVQPNDEIHTFILFKVDDNNKNLEILQVNRTPQQQQHQNFIKPKTENLLATGFNSSLVSCSSSLTTSTSAMTLSKAPLTNSNGRTLSVSYEYLNFTINTIALIIFENILKNC